MFSKATLFFTTAVVIAAVGAVPTSAMTEPTTGQCSTGPIKCCNTVEEAETSSFLGTLGMLELIDTSTITGVIAYGNCNPVLSSGTTCNSQAVCCTGNTFNGFINIGCMPISLTL